MIDSQVIKLHAWLLDNVLLDLDHIGIFFPSMWTTYILQSGLAGPPVQCEHKSGIIISTDVKNSKNTKR